MMQKPHIYHTLVYSNNSYKKRECDIVVNSKHNKTKYQMHCHKNIWGV